MMKKLFVLIGFLFLLTSVFAQEMTVQVLMPETKNLTAGDTAWLPGMVQDKLKSNLQDYLGMKILIDSSIEKQIKKVQQEAEDTSRDEASAIELGKISTAKFSLFSKISKTNSGYSLSVNYVDNTSGAQIATALSKSYLKSDSLYGTTGAVDEITLALAEKLKILLSDLQKKKLSQNSENFTLDEELAISKQNDEQYKKMMKEYDEDIAKLMQSNDPSAIENKKRIEADKALLVEKQNSEKKRLQELEEQKKRNEQDAKLEAERSIALKTQRDKMAKEAAEKAAEVRKLKLEKAGVLGQINVLEAKKKALVEIRQGVEKRCNELYAQFEKDDAEQNYKILTAEWSSVELKDGKPIDAAKQRRANRVKENNDILLKKFYKDCDSVKSATLLQQNELLADIKADISKLSNMKTVTSLGDELKVAFGTYNSENYGWNAYYSLYSDGFLIYQDSFILKYETLTGKTAPQLETATDLQLDEYIANTDMYNSLLVRCTPIVYFELDYTVTPAKANEPSKYIFNFNNLRVINILTGKTIQANNLSKKYEFRIPNQNNDIREIRGVKYKREIIEAARTPESLKQYWKQNVKNLVTVNGDKLPQAIENISEETVFIVNGEISEAKLTKCLENTRVPIHLDLSNASFEKNSEYEKQIKGNSIISVLLPNKKLLYKTRYSFEDPKACYLFESKNLLAICSYNSSFYTRLDANAVVWNPDNSHNLFSLNIQNPLFYQTKENDYVYCLKMYFYLNLEEIIKNCNSNLVIPDGVLCKDLIDKIKVYKTKLCLDISDCKSITKIDYQFFKGCDFLTKIILPDTISSIEGRAFEECSSLKTVELPDSVVKIDSGCFQYCKSLTTVKLPHTLKEIPNYAFAGCMSLSSFDMSRVIEIGNDAFRGCKSLTSINLDYVRTIGNCAFVDCESLTNIEFNSIISFIGPSAFENCKSLKTIILPESNYKTAKWRDYVHEKSVSYENPTIKILINGLTIINGGTFKNCESLETIRIPSSVYFISYTAFDGCKSLKKIEVSEYTFQTLKHERVTNPIYYLDNHYIPRVFSSQYDWYDCYGTVGKKISEIDLGLMQSNFSKKLRKYKETEKDKRK